MFISNENYLVETKSVKHVIRKKDNAEFDIKTLYLKTDDGTIIEVAPGNDMIYEKATPGSKYKIKIKLTDDGKLKFNDIELVK